MGALRLEIAHRHDLIPEGKYNLFWVTEFPLYECSDEEGRYVAMHHPFTSCMPRKICHLLKAEMGKVRARAYDLVLNGIEMGSGSIRIHSQRGTVADVRRMIGITDEEAHAPLRLPAGRIQVRHARRTAASPSASTAW